MAQKALNREVSIQAVGQPLKAVLGDMEKQGNFYFSYSSGLIAEDSLVSLQVTGKKVSETLRILFKDTFQYKVVGEHIIIQKAHPEKYIVLEGVLRDIENEGVIDNASVYSKAHLVYGLTDDNGHFKLRIKEKLLPVSITISRLGYQDTTFTYTGTEETGRIYLSRKIYALDEVVIARSKRRGRFRMGFLVSKSQKIHSLNLGNFFMALPYQMSLVPGAGTQGKLSSQVVNKVSINMIGGYTGGVHGAEIAGVFNTTKQNAEYFQAAGLFNTVLGSVKGFQAGGLYNTVADSVNGFQAGGIFNTVGGTTSGVQVAGVVNSTRHLSGVQVGLINFAESSDGVSIGLLNFIKNGKLDIQAYTDEVFPAAMAIKTGTSRFYTSLVLGSNFFNEPLRYGFGLYVGTEVRISDRWTTQLEAGQAVMASGKWNSSVSFLRFQPELHYRVSPRVSVFAGPSLSAYRSAPGDAVAGNARSYFESRTSPLSLGSNWILWAGWQAGIALHLRK
ncbi:MAG: hypothetical protein ABS46_01335 [Cytophagaceae bacterium SCN 52-12]|nr:MAG: hypothetical protein ABS46_01335 [Cytophagaceae bacterium SCN 52-12]